MPPDVRRALRYAIDGNKLNWHESGVETVDSQADELVIRLRTKTTLSVDRILLATGFLNQRPGGRFVDSLIASASLPCAECGYPIVDSSLRWHPRVYVSGPLAELELGPVSRNIAGARRAADRLVASIPGKRCSHHIGS